MSTFVYTDYSPSDLIGATLININTSFRSILELVHEATEIVGKNSVVEGCELQLVTPGNASVTSGKFVVSTGALYTKLFAEAVTYAVAPNKSYFVFFNSIGNLEVSETEPGSTAVFIGKIDINADGEISVTDLRNTSILVNGTRELFNGRSAVLSLKKKQSGMLLEGYLNSTKTFSLSSEGNVVANSVKVIAAPVAADDVVNKGLLDSELSTLNQSVTNLNTSLSQDIVDLQTSITNLSEEVETNVSTSITMLEAKINSQSFAQLLVIGDLQAHAANGPIHDFYLNTDRARTLRKVAVTCPQTSETGSIDIDLLVITTPGGTPVSLFETKPKPTITCNGGASWVVLSGSALETLNIPDNSLIQLTIQNASANCFDLRVELFE